MMALNCGKFIADNGQRQERRSDYDGRAAAFDVLAQTPLLTTTRYSVTLTSHAGPTDWT